MSGYQPNSYSQSNNFNKKEDWKTYDFKSKYDLSKPIVPESRPSNDNMIYNKSQLNKAMYTSNIEMSNPGKFEGKLGLMGRFVDEKPENHQNQAMNSFDQNYKRSIKNQMASSSIFGQSEDNEIDRFPQFNLHAVKKIEKPDNHLNQNMKKMNLEDWETRKKKETENMKNDSDSLTRRLENAKLKGLTKKAEDSMSFKKPEEFMASKNNQANFENKADSSKEFFAKKFEKKEMPTTNYKEELSAQGNNANEHLFKKKKGPYMEEVPEKNSISKPQQPYSQISKGKVESTPTSFKKSDFLIGKKMGKGQFGEVNIVQHKKTGFLCGMKIMEKKLIKTMNYQNQIARELSIQFYLAHRNIIPLFGYFSDHENVYLLIEFCTHGQLLEKLRKARKMSEADVSPIIKQIIQGIDYIHKQLIIHRDIKPQNILFSFDTVKICDFGWAVYKGQGMRKTASGSPLYYSPEIIKGDEYDEKIDIWDIGMMAYECLFGKIPFKIYSELDLKKIVTDEISFPDYVDIEQDTKDFIIRSLKKDPEQRITLKEMLRHPFITKYKQKRPEQSIMDEIYKLVRG